MKAPLCLEYVGADSDRAMRDICTALPRVFGRPPSRRPWVAALTVGPDGAITQRTFLRPNWQYKRANSKGSRGVELWFTLEFGKVYEVFAPASWGRNNRYFSTVNGSGDVTRVSREDLWLWASAV